MPMRRTLVLPVLSIFTIPGLLMAYSAGPNPGLTGGFGEFTCQQCHSSFPLNEGRTHGGMFHLLGVPRTYEAGASYPLTVVIAHPGQSRWGFELSVRHSSSGAQAGRLVPVDEMTQVKERAGIQYIEHTSAGTRQGLSDGPVEFHLNWVAPDPKAGPVIFNAAGNAANSSRDPMGDYIYTAGAYSVGAGTGEAPQLTNTKREEKPPLRLNTTARLINLPIPKELKRGSIIFSVEHRFLGALADSRPGNAFGIDEGANINLEFAYAASNRISFGIQRARFAEAGPSFAPAVIALSGTFSIRNKESSPWKMALVAGIEGQENFERQYSPFLQLTTALDYKRLSVFVVPTMVFNSRDDRALEQLSSIAIHPDADSTFSLGIGGDFALNSRLSVAGEYVPRMTGFGGFGKEHPAVSAGLNIRTWRHVFTILVSRSRDFTPARYAINSDGPWTLGFNIYRQIK